jgi:hypothetical protein
MLSDSDNPSDETSMLLVAWPPLSHSMLYRAEAVIPPGAPGPATLEAADGGNFFFGIKVLRRVAEA